ncbi:MAG: YtrH family sporulation protein [bacterium]|jgi:hypothetical protein
MSLLLEKLIVNFCIAFGVIAGASLFAGLSAIITNHPPLRTMTEIAASLKIWAVAVTLGGTFSSLEALELGLFAGDLRTVAKQVAAITAALMGANAGYTLIRLVENCGRLWAE